MYKRLQNIGFCHVLNITYQICACNWEKQGYDLVYLHAIVRNKHCVNKRLSYFSIKRKLTLMLNFGAVKGSHITYKVV